MKEQLTNQSSNQERRFVPATESTAKNRLDDFRGAVKDYQKEHPEFLGATVYGSMIKGEQATENSDVDAFLYVDKELIAKNDDLEKEESFKDEYRSNFLNTLKVPEEERSKYYGDLRVQLLDENVIKDEINSKIQFLEKEKAFKEMIAEKYNYEASDEEKQNLLSQEPEHKTISFGTSGMFHARVGSGIDKYRHIFLEKLNSLPDKNISNEVWNDVYAQLTTMEQRKDPEKQIQIPETLNDALRTYHPDLYRKIVEEGDEVKAKNLKSKIESMMQ
jgi:predicted nucleotidyltransferase